MMAMRLVATNQLNWCTASGANIKSTENDMQSHGHIISKQGKMMCPFVSGIVAETVDADMTNRARAET